MITSQRRLFLLWMCVLLLVFVILYLFPQWAVYVAWFLQTHRLFIGVVLLLTLLFLLLWKYPQRQVAAVRDKKDRIDLETKSRQTLAQIVGGAVLLGGLYFTAQTLRMTQEGQITDRFTKAIDQLGKDNLAVRLGGIYALERIARDSESDYGTVMEVLTAFVREHRPAKTLPPDNISGERETKRSPPAQKPPADIQGILTVIGRRTRTLDHGERQRLDLSGAQLQGAQLRGAQLQGVLLVDTQLQKADLMGARLQRAFLVRAQLQEAALNGAQLQDAFLHDTQLQEADLNGAQLQGADLFGAQLQGADLFGAQLQGTDLRRTENLTQEQINRACIDENTQLPKGLARPAPCSIPALREGTSDSRQ